MQAFRLSSTAPAATRSMFFVVPNVAPLPEEDPLPDAVDHMFLDHDTDLLGKIGPGREFSDTLADDLALR